MLNKGKPQLRNIKCGVPLYMKFINIIIMSALLNISVFNFSFHNLCHPMLQHILTGTQDSAQIIIIQALLQFPYESQSLYIYIIKIHSIFKR